MYMPLRHVHTRQVDYLTRVYITRTHMRTYDVHLSCIRICVYIYTYHAHMYAHGCVYTRVYAQHLVSQKSLICPRKSRVYPEHIAVLFMFLCPCVLRRAKEGQSERKRRRGVEKSGVAYSVPNIQRDGAGRGGGGGQPRGWGGSEEGRVEILQSHLATQITV